jgi:hypothetical protein
MASDDSTLLECIRAVIALSTKEAKEVIAESNLLLANPRDEVRRLDPVDPGVASETGLVDDVAVPRQPSRLFRNGDA